MEFLLSLDYWAILKIIGIDILLGGDNAVLIGLAVAGLAPEVRNKAIMFGTAGAIGARVFFLAIAGLLFGLPLVKLLGGLYLFYIAYSLLAASEEDSNVAQKTSIWAAVGTIVLADLTMSMDNILAITAASQSAGEHALFYMIAGVVLSIPIIIYGSKLVIALMEKFPIVIWLGGMLLGWVATEMIITEPLIKERFTFLHDYSIILKSIGFLSVGLMAKLTLNKPTLTLGEIK